MLEEVVQHGVARCLVHEQLEVVGLHAIGKFEIVQLDNFPEMLCRLQGEATMLRICHPGFFAIHATKVAGQCDHADGSTSIT